MYDCQQTQIESYSDLTVCVMYVNYLSVRKRIDKGQLSQIQFSINPDRVVSVSLLSARNPCSLSGDPGV